MENNSQDFKPLQIFLFLELFSNKLEILPPKINFANNSRNIKTVIIAESPDSTTWKNIMGKPFCINFHTIILEMAKFLARILLILLNNC